jgi:hypothetical protein
MPSAPGRLTNRPLCAHDLLAHLNLTVVNRSACSGNAMMMARELGKVAGSGDLALSAGR